LKAQQDAAPSGGAQILTELAALAPGTAASAGVVAQAELGQVARERDTQPSPALAHDGAAVAADVSCDGSVAGAAMAQDFDDGPMANAQVRVLNSHECSSMWGHGVALQS
jgi:hypothetical protein